MEDNRVSKFNFCSKVILLGLLYTILAGLFAYIFYLINEWEFLSLWLISFIVALICLMIFSIPRRVVVSPTQIRIICVLELTEINIADIIKIRKVNPRSMKWIIPLFAGNGFFGYYGIFFDLRRMERIKMYTTEWRYLVEIVDIYEDRYYISCRDCDALIKDVQQKRNTK